MDTKQAYEDKLEAQLREWRARIDQLQAKADRAEAESRIEYQQQIETLREKQAELSERLDELRASGEGAWQDVRSGTEAAWRDLEEAVQRALERFR